MSTTFLKPLILITEGKIDASIICSIINIGDRNVFTVSAGGYQNIASMLRTYYLMYGDDYNYIAVFDSDSDYPYNSKERLAMVINLSRTYYHSENIGIFCFRNTIEKELGLPPFTKGGDQYKLIKVIRARKEEMLECDTIKEIQAFVNQLS